MKSRHGMPRRAACAALIRRSAIACNDFPPKLLSRRRGAGQPQAGCGLGRTRHPGRQAGGAWSTRVVPRRNWRDGALRPHPRGGAVSAAAPLARRQHHHHLAAFHARLRFDLGVRLRIGLDPLQDLPAELLMGELATAKAQRDLDLVAVVEEALHGAHFDVIVMIVDAGAHFDFFDLDDLLALARLGGFFLLLIFVFAVIQHLGHRWVGVGRNLNQIEPRRHSTRQRVGNRYYAYIIAIFIDQSHFADPDVLIHPWTSGLALRRGPHWASYWAVSFNGLRSQAAKRRTPHGGVPKAPGLRADIRKE